VIIQYLPYYLHFIFNAISESLIEAKYMWSEKFHYMYYKVISPNHSEKNATFFHSILCVEGENFNIEDFCNPRPLQIY